MLDAMDMWGLSSLCYLQIPYGMIALSLACFIVPLCAGCLLKYKRSDWATRIQRFAKPYFLVCLVIVPGCALVTNMYYFTVVTWRHLRCWAVAGWALAPPAVGGGPSGVSESVKCWGVVDGMSRCVAVHIG